MTATAALIAAGTNRSVDDEKGRTASKEHVSGVKEHVSGVTDNRSKKRTLDLTNLHLPQPGLVKRHCRLWWSLPPLDEDEWHGASKELMNCVTDCG